MKFKLFAAAALLAVSTLAVPAQAGQYTLNCGDKGARLLTEMPRSADGAAIFIAPRVVGIACRIDSGPDVYTLPGLPGEYTSTKAIEGTIDDMLKVLNSAAMKGIAEPLPPAMKFVKQLSDERKAADAKHKSARTGNSPGMLDQKR